MKRIVFIVLSVIILPVTASAAGYVIGNYAMGGKIDEPSIGIEMGAIFLSDLHPTGGALSVGVGISVGDTDEDPPTGLQPTTGAMTYDLLKEYNDGTEQEIYMALGAEITMSFFGVAGLGYSSQDKITLGTSGGEFYEVETEVDNNISGIVGMRYVIEGLNMGLGYHTRRGIMASIGIAF